MAEPGARLALVVESLTEDVARILGASPGRIDAETPLTQLGLDSLMAVELSQRLGARLGVEVPSMKLLVGGGIRKLAEQILPRLAPTRQTDSAPTNPANPRAKGDAWLPLSYQQLPIWRLERAHPGQSFYNLANLLHCHGPMDAAALERAWLNLLERHEALRMRFRDSAGEPRQRVLDAPNPLRTEDLGPLSESEREAAAHRLLAEESTRPFQIEEEAPIRARWARFSDRESALLVTLHHLCGDGTSVRLALEDLVAEYRAVLGGIDRSTTIAPRGYLEFVQWQRERFGGAACAEAIGPWRRALGNRLPPLPLPTDFPRPERSSHRGERQPFRVPAEVARGLRELSAQENATLFATLLAALALLVRRAAGVEGFCLGTFVANRDRSEWASVIGCFTNCVPIPVDLRGAPMVRDLLRHARDSIADALSRAELPFALLVERFRSEPPSPAPWLPVVLILHSEVEVATGVRVRVTDEVEAVYAEGANRGAKRDWTFHCFEAAQGLTGYLEYDTELFRADTAARACVEFEQLLARIVADPDRTLSPLADSPAAAPASP